VSAQLPPNVRWVEESYSETWPTVAQYGAVHFGPVVEGLHVVLPTPIEASKLRVEEQWAWFHAPENMTIAMNAMLNWNLRLIVEREQVFTRLRAVVIERVNAALLAGEIRNAVLRDPSTGKQTVPPATSLLPQPASSLCSVPGFGSSVGGLR
jgi:hypothetical protein